jgi:small subunit ribosomal protein S5
MADNRSMSPDFVEQVVWINRVTKVVKGGKNMSFSALVVVGDRKGKVGYALGKAQEVPLAIQKATARARRRMRQFSLVGTTVPHESLGRHGGGRVFLRPASPGTGVIAGGPVRAVMEAVGIRDILTKSLGSANPINVVKATLAALGGLRSPHDVAAGRGKDVASMEIADYIREQLTPVREGVISHG